MSPAAPDEMLPITRWGDRRKPLTRHKCAWQEYARLGEKEYAMSLVSLRYATQQSFREQEFLRTGETPDPFLKVSVETTALTEKARQGLLVRKQLQSWEADLLDPDSLKIETTGYDAGRIRSKEVKADHYLTPEDAAIFLERLVDRYTELLPLAQQAKQDYEAHERIRLAEEKSRQARRAAEEQARREAEKKAREEAEAAKRAWIEAHGSDFLRRAFAAGYDCQRRYVTERAGQEHPDATIDFDGNAGWRSRSCPSEAALDLAEQVSGEVVWLTAPPHEDEGYYEPNEQHEAVIVRNYLGSYTVVYLSV